MNVLYVERRKMKLAIAQIRKKRNRFPLENCSNYYVRNCTVSYAKIINDQFVKKDKNFDRR